MLTLRMSLLAAGAAGCAATVPPPPPASQEQGSAVSSATPASSSAASASAASASSAAASAERAGWRLVWREEFDGAGLPDPRFWSYEVGKVRNQEAQFYTEGRKENARREGGSLILEARKEQHEGSAYTSASITTQDKQWFYYGRVEVRARLPHGTGSWPAIWMLGKNRNAGVGWPRCGEIDIMENVGFEHSLVHATVHTGKNHGGGAIGATLRVEDPWSTFHVYAVEWFEDRLDFFVDQQKLHSYESDGRNDPETWPFNQPFYLLLNIAIGGAWGGLQGIDDAAFPHRMHVDYVRYYQR